ncbi:response regulator transcription factor [Streptosporangium subroseum]
MHRGEAAVAPRLLTRLIGTFVRVARPRRGTTPGQLAGLTDREREVLTLIARGQFNTEICQTLGMAGSTVKNHVTSLFAKTGVRDRAQAVIIAYEAGLIIPGDCRPGSLLPGGRSAGTPLPGTKASPRMRNSACRQANLDL